VTREKSTQTGDRAQIRMDGTLAEVLPRFVALLEAHG